MPLFKRKSHVVELIVLKLEVPYPYLEFGAWEDMDQNLENGNVVAVHRFSSWRPNHSGENSTIRSMSSHAPIPKEKYLCVQLTELYIMRP